MNRIILKLELDKMYNKYKGKLAKTSKIIFEKEVPWQNERQSLYFIVSIFVKRYL